MRTRQYILILIVGLVSVVAKAQFGDPIIPIDEGQGRYYYDGDSDGFGDPNAPYITYAGTGYVQNNFDCNDSNANIHPFSPEVCDGIDNNCDGRVDDGIQPAIPAVVSVNNNCGSSVLTRSNPPNGITWYWQSSALGTSTSNASTSITRTSGSRYYLRGRNNSTRCWGPARSISYSVGSAPATPGVVSVSNGCGSSVLTRSNPPSGITWYWQSSALGTSTSNASVSLTRTSGSVYYLRGRNGSGCWGVARSVSYSIGSAITWYADNDGDGLGDANTTLSACTQPPGYVSNSSDQCPNEDGEGASSGCPIKVEFSDENYIVTRTYREPTATPIDGHDKDTVMTTVQYYDGLGRLKQTIGVEAGGGAEDIVTHVEYDALGRRAKEYLSFTSGNNNANLRTGDIGLSTQQYYQQKYADDFAGVSLPKDINAYSEKAFENSPLNRVLQQAAPGKDWKLGNGHEIKFDYDTNTNRDVREYYVTTTFANNTYTPTLQLNIASSNNYGYYNAGELYKSITKDENWTSGVNHTIEEFKNKQGQVVLKRNYNNNQAHDTYYVYDDFGNLTYVIPPKVEGTVGKPNGTALNELCYQYKYDYRNRLVEKKIPGKGWEYIIYDNLDRPVLTQDANLKPRRKWLFTKYDKLGRIIYTGEYTHNADIDRVAMQNYFESNNNSEEKYFEEKISVPNGVHMSYSNVNFPSANTQVHTINYYDNYDFYLAQNSASVALYKGNGKTSTDRLNGLATGAFVRTLDGPQLWTITITHYDEKARPIHIYSKNESLGTTDIVESLLDDFTGKVLETKTTHKKSGKADVITIDRFEYDHMDRLVSQTQQINDQISERIVKNNYDDLGQLESKLLGNGTKAGYRYNVESVVSVTNDVITKIGGRNSVWDGDISTQGSISGDGYVEFISDTKGKYYMVGLSNNNNSATFSSIKYAIYINHSVYIYESGTNKGIRLNYEIGDSFRVERVGNTIHYKKNGETFYTSQNPSNGELFGDVSMYHIGGKIKDFKIVDNSQGLQKVDYDYNVRGWLTKINEDTIDDNDIFDFSIRYNTIEDVNKRLYNGNIAQTSWHTQNTNVSTKAYTYTYDALNRITTAIGATTSNYNVSGITYDKNGNILSLQRQGHTNTAATAFGLMDDLSYNYDNGNKLLGVDDDGEVGYGYIDKSNSGNDYAYDANGNMISDANKGITSIRYNHLNLPSVITGSQPYESIQYKYDASGTKLEKQVISLVNGNYQKTDTEYAGNYVYENDELQFFSHSEGYVKKDGDTFNYVYQYKDHLGNIRLSYTDANQDGKITASATQIFYDDASNSNGWDSVGALYGSSATIDGKHAISDSKAIKLSRTGAGDIYAHCNEWIPINNSTATDYIFSGWVYVEAPSNAYGRIILYMNENDETGYFTQIGVGDKIREKNKWVYTEKRVTVPANIDKLNLRVDIYTGGSKVEGWFDDLQITKVNTVASEIVEEGNYYPFGLKHKGYNTAISALGNSAAQKFGYNGKEFNDELGLNWLDYGWRNYDAALSRWMGIDPLAESTPTWTPYNYVQNTPINAIDPDGLSCVGCGPNGENYTPPEINGYSVIGNAAGAGNGPGDPPILYNGPGTAVGDNVSNLLDEVEIGGSSGATVSGGYSTEVDRYGWGSTTAEYQKAYGLEGMSYNQMYNWWSKNHAADFATYVNKMDDAERSRKALLKLKWYGMVFEPMSTVLAPSFGFPSIAPRGFSLKFMPRSSSSNGWVKLNIDNLDELDNVAGLYKFQDATRGLKIYTGQSQNIFSRLNTHFNNGRIGGDIYFMPMKGSTKLAREIIETRTIISIGRGNLKNTANLRFPVSRARASRLGLNLYE